MNRPGVRKVQEGSGEQGKMEETGCEIICGAQATLVVKGLMMIMMMMKEFADQGITGRDYRPSLWPVCS